MTHWCSVCCLLCRPNRPISNPAYGNEYIDSGSGGVALTSMTKNPSYMTAKEVVTSFPSSTVEDKKDNTYEELQLFEANEKG